MKLAIISDSHFGAKNDSDNLYEVQRNFFEEQFFPYLIKHDIKQILHLGDLFDRRKFINFKTLDFFNRVFIEPLKQNSIAMDIIAGNHDVFHKNTNTLNSLHLLLPKDINIYINPIEKTYDDKLFFLSPWITKDNYDDFIALREKTQAKVCFGHFDFSGFDMLPGVKSYHGFSGKDFKKFDRVMSGHYHTKSDDGHIFYLGVQYEINWADYADKKGFHVYDTETDELDFIVNEKIWHHKILYNDKKNDYNKLCPLLYKDGYVKIVVEEKENPYMLEKLVEKIQKSGVVDLKVVELEKDDVSDFEMDSFEVTDTFSHLERYVEENDTLKDKDSVKGILSSIYIEALSSDEN